jgi:hypothetical protein
MGIESFPLGAKVYAVASCGVCEVGERGVVVEQYQLGGRQGVSILFERGASDGFSEEECSRFVVAEGSLDPRTSAYPYQGPHALRLDRERGAFAKAFDTEPYAQWLAKADQAALEQATPRALSSRPRPRA